ncbi:MAG: hypothetical protein ABFS19_03710 [Thermodesulfobacteriota bacterium]
MTAQRFATALTLFFSCLLVAGCGTDSEDQTLEDRQKKAADAIVEQIQKPLEQAEAAKKLANQHSRQIEQSINQNMGESEPKE